MHYCPGEKTMLAPTTEKKNSIISLLVIWACAEKHIEDQVM